MRYTDDPRHSYVIYQRTRSSTYKEAEQNSHLACNEDINEEDGCEFHPLSKYSESDRNVSRGFELLIRGVARKPNYY